MEISERRWRRRADRARVDRSASAAAPDRRFGTESDVVDLARRSSVLAQGVLLRIDEEYADILAMLDHAAAVRRMVDTIPALTGLDVAWIGEPVGNDRIVLRQPVNMAADNLVDGLVVPEGR